MKTIHKATKFDRGTIILHWVIAVLVFTLFFVGIWMVELGYYDPWYHRAPWWHKSVGVLLFIILSIRWVWNNIYNRNTSLPIVNSFQEKLSHFVHHLLNVFIVLISISGYFIVTAKGQGVTVFDWFHIPALLTGVANLEDWAGEVHYYLAYVLMGFVTLHILAALKHHFLDKDDVLMNMLGRRD
tara:strand:+ start:115 stop:666 length:552 start_codon:yes stop_codon:yes gene_type:complete